MKSFQSKQEEEIEWMYDDGGGGDDDVPRKEFKKQIYNQLKYSKFYTKLQHIEHNEKQSREKKTPDEMKK